MRALVGRREVFNQLLFYSLDHSYFYGGAEDHDIFFAAKAHETLIKKRNRRRLGNRIDLDQIFFIMEQPTIIRPNMEKFKKNIDDDLIQIPLECRRDLQAFAQNVIDFSDLRNKLQQKKHVSLHDDNHELRISQFIERN